MCAALCAVYPQRAGEGVCNYHTVVLQDLTSESTQPLANKTSPAFSFLLLLALKLHHTTINAFAAPRNQLELCCYGLHSHWSH